MFRGIGELFGRNQLAAMRGSGWRRYMQKSVPLPSAPGASVLAGLPIVRTSPHNRFWMTRS